MSSRKFFYQAVYRTDDETKLSWHRKDVPEFIKAMAADHREAETVLDIGCGTGENAVYFAKLGFRVTALDFVEKALRFAEKRAEESRVSVRFVHEDLFRWEAPQTYDLILDSGCLHNFRGKKRRDYKTIVLGLMHDRSCLILAHFSGKPRFALPFGPVKRSKEQIVSFFSPELRLLDFQEDGELYDYCFSRREQAGPVSRAGCPRA